MYSFRTQGQPVVRLNALRSTCRATFQTCSIGSRTVRTFLKLVYVQQNYDLLFTLNLFNAYVFLSFSRYLTAMFLPHGFFFNLDNKVKLICEVSLVN